MLIVGAGGHAKEIALVLARNGEADLIFFEETPSSSSDLFLNKWPVVKGYEDLKNLSNKNIRFVLATGNPLLRFRFYQSFLSLGFVPFSVIDPTSIIGKSANIGSGINIMSFTFISENVTIKDGCLINAYVHIHHDAYIGEFCELSPSACVLGKVHLGAYCQLGSKSVVLPGVRLGDNVIVGAGAVVTQTLPDNSLAVGVPAKVIKKLSPLKV